MLCQRKMVQGLPKTIEEKNEVCDGCALGKHHRQSFQKESLGEQRRLPKSVPLSSSIESPTSSLSSPSSTPRKMRSLSDVYERCNLCIVEPQSFKEAIKDEDLRKAMEKEIDVIEKNETWQMVEKSKDKEIIGSDVDFHETFAPVARLDTIRTIIAMAAQKVEEIYVEQPQGFVVDREEKKVYKLKKTLYGLKQAPRARYTQIDNYFIENGFIRSKSEPTLYVKSKDNSQILIVALYVDDLVFNRNDEKMDKAYCVKYHFIKEAISNGEVQLMSCKLEEQVVDIFTKALPLEKLAHFKSFWVYRNITLGENIT
ncbi:hypothetical protein AAG906_039394 [Vitis piasezkii]